MSMYGCSIIWPSWSQPLLGVLMVTFYQPTGQCFCDCALVIQGFLRGIKEGLRKKKSSGKNLPNCSPRAALDDAAAAAISIEILTH